MKVKKVRKLPEDIWQPLYAKSKFSVFTKLTSFLWLELEYGMWYTRACQRWYGDNIESHIRRVK